MLELRGNSQSRGMTAARPVASTDGNWIRLTDLLYFFLNKPFKVSNPELFLVFVASKPSKVS